MFYYRFPIFFAGTLEGYLHYTHERQFTKANLQQYIDKANATDKDLDAILRPLGFIPIKWEGE